MGYEVFWSAPVLPAGTAITVGDIVCWAPDKKNVVVATTANLVSAVFPIGISLDNAPAGSSINYQQGAYADASITGIPAGVGPFANLNSSGRLVRSLTSGATTVGICDPTGGVFLNFARYGDTSNGSGGYWVNVTDPPYLAQKDDTGDQSAAINAAIIAAGKGGTVFFPRGKYRIANPIEIINDTAHGSIENVTLMGDGGIPLADFDFHGETTINWVGPRRGSTTGSCTAASAAQTCTGRYTDYSAVFLTFTFPGITFTTADIGERMKVTGFKTMDGYPINSPANDGLFLIADVVAGTNQCTLCYIWSGGGTDFTTGAVADAGNYLVNPANGLTGVLCKPIIKNYGSQNIIEHLILTIENETQYHAWCGIHSNEAPGNNKTCTRHLVRNCKVYTEGTGVIENGWVIGGTYLPSTTSVRHLTSGGFRLPWEPPQCDYMVGEEFQTSKMSTAGVYTNGFSGQSRENHVIRGGFVEQPYGILWEPSSSNQVNGNISISTDACVFSKITQCAIQLGGSSAMTIHKNPACELIARFYRQPYRNADSGSPMPVIIFGGYINVDTGITLYSSDGYLLDVQSPGPVTCIGTQWVVKNGDGAGGRPANTTARFRLGSTNSVLRCQATFIGCYFPKFRTSSEDIYYPYTGYSVTEINCMGLGEGSSSTNSNELRPNKFGWSDTFAKPSTLTNIAGLSFGTVTPNNATSTVTITAGGTASSTWTFATAEANTDYKILPFFESSTGAFAAGGADVIGFTKATSGCSVTVRADPTTANVVLRLVLVRV